MTSIELGSYMDPDWKSSKNPIFRYFQMQKYNNQAKLDSKQKSRNKALIILNVLSYRIGVSKSEVIREAMKTYNKILRLRMIKGRTIELAIIVSLYYACQQYNYPISIEKVVEASDNKYQVKQVNKYYRKVISSFQQKESIHIDLEEIAIDTMSKIDGLTNDTYRKVLSKVKIVEASRIYLGRPTVYAVALIYLVAKKNGNKITQKVLSKVTDISQKSISEKCKEISKIGLCEIF